MRFKARNLLKRLLQSHSRHFSMLSLSEKYCYFPIYLTGANQSVRVQIDEEGVKAAAYIEIPGAGSAAPPEEVIDFVLDRPFLFVITPMTWLWKNWMPVWLHQVPVFAGKRGFSMKSGKFSDALGEIDISYVEEVANYKAASSCRRQGSRYRREGL